MTHDADATGPATGGVIGRNSGARILGGKRARTVAQVVAQVVADRHER